MRQFYDKALLPEAATKRLPSLGIDDHVHRFVVINRTPAFLEEGLLGFRNLRFRIWPLRASQEVLLADIRDPVQGVLLEKSAAREQIVRLSYPQQTEQRGRQVQGVLARHVDGVMLDAFPVNQQCNGVHQITGYPRIGLYGDWFGKCGVIGGDDKHGIGAQPAGHEALDEPPDVPVVCMETVEYLVSVIAILQLAIEESVRLEVVDRREEGLSLRLGLQFAEHCIQQLQVGQVGRALGSGGFVQVCVVRVVTAECAVVSIILFMYSCCDRKNRLR